ncbi:MAG TPA: hypothetical protein VMI06_01175 [Terriglobia bacterium]|nr:hypothetical protein [Terriglobia bacterium]
MKLKALFATLLLSAFALAAAHYTEVTSFRPQPQLMADGAVPTPPPIIIW